MQLEICDSPVFVLGAPRSGTSMMQWSLRRHPHLWGGQESDYLIRMIRDLRETHEFGRTRGRLHWLSGQNVEWPEFLRHVGFGINSLYMSRSNGLRWVEQTPQYTLHLDDIGTMFPGAVFINMLRDGRSVVHSLRNFVNPVEHEDACRTWARFVQAAERYVEAGEGDRMLTVRFERVVGDTEPALARVYEFLGEPPEPRSVEFIKSSSPINSSFVGEPGTAKVLPRWAGWTPQERETFQSIAGEQLIRLGFEADDAWLTRTFPEFDGADAGGVR